MRDSDSPTFEALYHQLVRLRDEMPAWNRLHGPDGRRWLGRALALVEATGFLSETVNLQVQVQTLVSPIDVTMFEDVRPVRAVAITIETVIAKLELKLPVQAQGAFIPAGGLFDAFQAVAKAVGEAQSDVLLVDPYADETLIADFAPLVPERVRIRVLSDTATAKPSLRPAAGRWIAQYPTRPLEVRLAPARALHDRIIIADETIAWVLGQSFKDLAKRAHSSLVRMDAESAGLKVAAYKAIWSSATALA
jgi:hypothetical protein